MIESNFDTILYIVYSLMPCDALEVRARDVQFFQCFQRVIGGIFWYRARCTTAWVVVHRGISRVQLWLLPRLYMFTLHSSHACSVNQSCRADAKCMTACHQSGYSTRAHRGHHSVSLRFKSMIILAIARDCIHTVVVKTKKIQAQDL